LSPVNSSAAAASPSARTTTDARFCVRALATETYSFARAFTHHRIRQSFNSSLCARSPLLAVCLSPLSGFRPFAHASSRAFPRLSRRLRARDRDRTTFRFLSQRAPTGPRSHRPSHPRASPSIHPHRRRHPPRRVGRLHPPDSTAPPPSRASKGTASNRIEIHRVASSPRTFKHRPLIAEEADIANMANGGSRVTSRGRDDEGSRSAGHLDTFVLFFDAFESDKDVFEVFCTPSRENLARSRGGWGHFLSKVRTNSTYTVTCVRQRAPRVVVVAVPRRSRLFIR